MKPFWALCAVTFAISGATPAAAALLEYQYNGSVVGVFGATDVAVGDIAHVRVRFDPADFIDVTAAANAAYGTPTPYANLLAAQISKPGEDLEVSIGSHHFTVADQFAFAGGDLGTLLAPFALFNSGVFFGVQYFGVNPGGEAFVTSGAAGEPFDFVGGPFAAGGPAYGGYFDYTDARSHAVPEPATWALLIGGFSLAGASLRRRRSQAPGASA